MVYIEEEKNEIERVRKVFEEHIRQCTGYELLWSDKVGYVWLSISLRYHYIDTGRQIVSATDLCCECLNDIAMDVLLMTGNDHALEEAEIKHCWKPYIEQLPEYANLCDDLLNGRR